MKKTLLTTAALLACVAAPALAEIQIEAPYARAATPTAKAGAAFMVIENTGAAADRLIGASSDAAARVELHTHEDMGEGVMRMVHVEEGFEIPAGASHMLMRGGDHVMLMGLTRSLTQGDTVTVTLTFEQAGEVVVSMPVDLERAPRKAHSGH